MSLITSDQRRVIVGLGQSGLSVARYFCREGLSFSVIDTRDNPPGLEQLKALKSDVECISADLSVELLQDATQLIVSPGISVQTEVFKQLHAKGIEIIGDIELFCRHVSQPIIAITGSNAKSTVTTLVGEMAKNSGINVGIGGNIGLPALDLLQNPADLYVLELSSFQLETTHSLNAEVATVLNVSADHLDRYDSYLAYQQSKLRIYKNAKHLVLNEADALSRPLMSDQHPYIGFKLNAPELKRFSTMTYNDAVYLCHGFQPLMPAANIKLVGRHNLENCLAALALGYAAGLNMAAMLDTLTQFKGLKHRCEWVATKAGVHYINDSKGTNVGATLAALEGLANKAQPNIVLIAGGVSKGADMSELTRELPKYVKHMVVIGTCADELVSLARIATSKALTLNDAVQQAQAHAQEGDVVLFSPACASFDMFKNFEHRGDCFVQEVAAL